MAGWSLSISINGSIWPIKQILPLVSAALSITQDTSQDSGFGDDFPRAMPIITNIQFCKLFMEIDRHSKSYVDYLVSMESR